MDDIYSSFSELALYEKEGKDYTIEWEEGNPDVVIIAVHGGEIEKGTSELAKEVAKRIGATYYSFKGTKGSNNRILHVTSVKFDEPTVLRLVERSQYTISIHGARGTEPLTYLGGRDDVFRELTAGMLQKAGFVIQKAPDQINGDHVHNIVNRGKRHMGLQLELSEALRQSFFEEETCSSTQFFRYAEVIEQAIKECIKKHEA